MKEKQVETLKALKSEKNKQEIKSIEGIFSKDMRTNEIINKTDEIKQWEEKTKRKDWKQEIKITYMIFSNIKQLNLLVKVRILVKL